MVYLLDTNIVSELRKPTPHGGVLAWYAAHPFESLHLSSITFYELQSGAERTRKQDVIRASGLDNWISGLELRMQIIPFGPVEARITAHLMRGLSDELLEDAMIAATAIANGLTVATRNTRDFERFNVSLVNPFLFPKS
jgi:predicted nucleic acid-binding protein